MSIGWLVALFVIAAALQSMLFSFANLRALEYRRRFRQTTAVEGERVELVETLRNAKPLPVPWVRVESRISPHLRFGAGDAEREISADQYHKSVFFLPPLRQVVRRHDVRCAKRGHYELGSVSITAGDLFGLSSNSCQLKRDCALTVYPRLLREDELDAQCSRWQGELAVKRWILPDPFLTAGIRDYRAGDPERDIHWRATARVGSMQVKLRDYTADPRMMVVLNVQTSEGQWGELMEDEQAAIEQGIRIAATLCVRALNMGVEAGFACNGCLHGEMGRGQAVIVPSSRRAEQQQLLLDTMARLIVHREINFPTFLEGLGQMRGEDILILSAYGGDSIELCMQKLRACGNSVTLALLEGGRRDA